MIERNGIFDGPEIEKPLKFVHFLTKITAIQKAALLQRPQQRNRGHSLFTQRNRDCTRLERAGYSSGTYSWLRTSSSPWSICLSRTVRATALTHAIRRIERQSVAAYKRATWRSGSRNRFTCPGNQARPRRTRESKSYIPHAPATFGAINYSFTLVQVVHQGTRPCDIRRDQLTPDATSRDSGTTSMWSSQRPKTISPRCSHSHGSQERIDHVTNSSPLLQNSRWHHAFCDTHTGGHPDFSPGLNQSLHQEENNSPEKSENSVKRRQISLQDFWLKTAVNTSNKFSPLENEDQEVEASPKRLAKSMKVSRRNFFHLISIIISITSIIKETSASKITVVPAPPRVQARPHQAKKRTSKIRLVGIEPKPYGTPCISRQELYPLSRGGRSSSCVELRLGRAGDTCCECERDSASRAAPRGAPAFAQRLSVDHVEVSQERRFARRWREQRRVITSDERALSSSAPIGQSSPGSSRENISTLTTNQV
ncbi:unnamed protein product [Trichogramma brassicae]|uniref:Uncharacterized protein n=1 Tax=Trichogramma brassicae TaxID=86971 RepID=A0A6H5IIZ7_9HYME|nr:unnamed protein product [Trichogramma brassicae]